MLIRFLRHSDALVPGEACLEVSYLTMRRHFMQPQRKLRKFFFLRLSKLGLQGGALFGSLLPKEPHSLRANSGTWERMARSVKHCLRKIVGRASLTFDEINTLFVEVESVSNTRPITYLYDDIDDISCALAPSHLIYGRRILDDPNDSLLEIVSMQDSLT